MLTADIITEARRRLGDTDEARWSRYDSDRAAEEALDWLSRWLARAGSELTLRRVTLADGDALPADWLYAKTVTAGGAPLVPQTAAADGEPSYRVEGGVFHTDAGEADVRYQALLTAGGGEIDLPPALRETLIRLVCVILAGGDDSAREAILAPHSREIARRAWAHRRGRMPFRV